MIDSLLQKRLVDFALSEVTAANTDGNRRRLAPALRLVIEADEVAGRDASRLKVFCYDLIVGRKPKKALVREGEAILSDIGRNYEVWLDPATDELHTSPAPGSVCLGTLPPGVDARAYAEAAWQEREAAHAD